MPVRLLFDSGQRYDGRAFRDCLHEAATHGVRIVRPQRGYRWEVDGVRLDILAPSRPVLADTGDDINENSIVAMLHYQNFRELFMGDAGESSEARLLASGFDLRADVLKAQLRPPHVIPSLSRDNADRGVCGDPSTSSV